MSTNPNRIARLAALLSIVALITIITACGNTGNPTKTPTSPKPKNTPTTISVTPTATVTTITPTVVFTSTPTVTNQTLEINTVIYYDQKSYPGEHYINTIKGMSLDYEKRQGCITYQYGQLTDPNLDQDSRSIEFDKTGHITDLSGNCTVTNGIVIPDINVLPPSDEQLRQLVIDYYNQNSSSYKIHEIKTLHRTIETQRVEMVCVDYTYDDTSSNEQPTPYSRVFEFLANKENIFKGVAMANVTVC